jgi:hypothetical protein
MAWSERAGGLLAGACCNQFAPLADASMAIAQISVRASLLVDDRIVILRE